MHQDFQTHGYLISEAVHLGLQGQAAAAWWKDLYSPRWVIPAPLSQGFSVRFGPHLPSLVHIQPLSYKRRVVKTLGSPAGLALEGRSCPSLALVAFYLFTLGHAGSSLVYGLSLVVVRRGNSLKKRRREVRRLLIAVASFVVEPGLQVHSLQ